jgi:hypothetical protein
LCFVQLMHTVTKKVVGVFVRFFVRHFEQNNMYFPVSKDLGIYLQQDGF